MNRQQHWNTVYSTKAPDAVSWFESVPEVSLEMLTAAGLNRHSCVVDVGGGESHLIDRLLQQGLSCVAVLDVSQAAIDRIRERLGAASEIATWLVTDVTASWHVGPMDIWHDRAVFHFLTEPADRDRYRARLLETLKVGGSAIVATFALDGPEKCSGLPVVRYSPESLAAELGPELELVEWRPHQHITPRGAVQSFQYSRFRRVELE